MDVVSQQILVKSAISEQQRYFAKRSIPKEFSEHGVLVAGAVEKTLTEHQHRLRLNDEELRSLVLLALYHPLPSLEGVSDEIKSQIGQLFTRFHMYRLLDEQPLPKDIDAYRRLMFLDNGHLDPAFLVRAIDLSQTHNFDAQQLERLYRIYGRTIGGTETRRNICISMLEVYYPVTDNLNFVNSDAIKNIAVQSLWPDDYKKIEMQCASMRQKIETAQRMLTKLLTEALRVITSKDKSLGIVANNDKLVYASRIKDVGSIVLKLLKKSLPTSIEYINDMIGFLIIVDDAKKTMRCATRLFNELKRRISSTLRFDPKCLIPREDGKRFPVVHIDIVHPVIAHGRELSPVGVEIQITDINGARECREGSFIHGASKQFVFFDKEKIINTKILEQLVRYLEIVYRETKAIEELKPPDLDVEYIEVECFINDGKKKYQTKVHIKEGSVLLDVLAQLGLLSFKTNTIDGKTGKAVLYDTQIETSQLRITVDRTEPGITERNAVKWVNKVKNPETKKAILEIAKAAKNNRYS